MDGTLTTELKAKLERHFGRCSSCRERYLQECERRAKIRSDAEFHPDDEYWRNFHTRLSTEMYLDESIHERLHRWKLALFPAALFQYSSFGLFKLIVLGLMVILSILLFRAERKESHLQDPASVRIEHDSTGMPLYRINKPK